MGPARPIALRPLGTSEILDGAVRLVRGNPRAVLSISVPFAVVQAALTALAQYAALSADTDTSLAALAGDILVLGLGTVLTGVLAPVLGGAVLGQPITARTAVAQVGRRAGPLVLLGLIVLVSESAGALLLGVGAIWLWGVWSVAAPALTLERLGCLAALGRSFTLVEGRFWRVWGIRALGWVVTSVLGLFVSLPFTVLAAALTDINPFTRSASTGVGLFVTVSAVGVVLRSAFVGPIASAIDVLLYADLRMRREGLDLVLAQQRPAGAASPAVSR